MASPRIVPTDSSEVWNAIRHAFPILEKNSPSEISELEFHQLAEKLLEYDLVTYVEDIVLNAIEDQLRQVVVPAFWSKFSGRVNEADGFQKFQKAVAELYDSLTTFLQTLENLTLIRCKCGVSRIIHGEESIMDTFTVLVRGTLRSQLPLSHSIITEDFYRISFKVFCNNDQSVSLDQDESAEETVQCGGCEYQVEECRCQSIIQIFHETNRKLIELELLERLGGDVITSLIHLRIENHVQESCKGSFDTSHITSLETWLDTVVLGWLNRMYIGDSPEGTPVRKKNEGAITQFKQKLSHLLYETYTRTRIEQLFNIIIEYPDSQPAIEDLHICLQKTDLRTYLVQKLQRALETRLLHPGVNTTDILTAYIAAIRALQQLDPSGVLLETVTQPVRQYLRRRDDTVRCVVSSLTEEGPSELADELNKGEALQLDECSISEEETDNWENWNPDPIDADPSMTSKSRRTSDIISMLVNVYGSKELFVNEYRTLLADRLLSQFIYNTEKEFRYLELLKLRFGEAHLHYCEVMLKDVFDSKRINSHIQSDPRFNRETQFITTAMVLSAQFWPPFKDETLELPNVVKEHFQYFTKAFETLKGNRTLCWKPHLGSVNLDIELKDKKLNLTISPIHATIIWHFQSKSQRTIEELSQLMQVPCTVLRRKIAFWQSQGLLKEVSPDTFLLVEESTARSKCSIQAEMMCEDEEAESAMASAHDQREEELQVFWSYIVGMLTNLDSMQLDRIHQMLKMFASQGPTSVECSLQELRHFLDRKVREHKLLFSGGFYRLPKS